MSGPMTWARLAFRLQPASIGFAAFLCLGLAAAALWLTADMRAALAQCGTSSAPEACDLIYAFQNTHGQAVQMTQMGIGFAQYAVPLALGVPIVTREIEHKTAMIAWPLAGSRLKWLAWRLVPVLVIGLALTGVMAFAADQLAQAYFPNSDIGFDRHGSRGVSLVTRAVLVLVAGVALGALIGRLLPALLVGIALAVGVSTGLDSVLRNWVEPTELAQSESVFVGAFPLTTGLEFRAPDGTPITDVEAEAIHQAVYEEHGAEADPALLPREVFYGVAASRYPEVLARESAAVLGATVAAAGVAAVVVRRRRPE
jgi:hypothetical protein